MYDSILEILKNDYISKEDKLGFSNVEIVELASKSDFKLDFGTNAGWNTPDELESHCEGIAINKELLKFFDSLGIKMTPSYDELQKHYEKKEAQDIPVVFSKDGEYAIEGMAYLGILSKSLDIWFDFNDVKILEMQKQ